MICNLQYQHKKRISSLILFLFSTSVFAANGHVYLGGTIDASVAKIGNGHPQINYNDGKFSDAYYAYSSDGNRSTTEIIGLNGGYEFVGTCFIPAIAVGLGIYVTQGEYYNFNGQRIETIAGDLGSTLYNYQYHINGKRLVAEAQFTWMWHKFTPFINIGGGVVWNRMTGYNEIPLNSTGDDVALPPFKSNVNTNFTYQIGFGLGYAFNFPNCLSDYQHERISLGYRYANLGNTSFATRGDVYPYSLDTGRLSTNELYFNYTHLF
jgi:hypothetical protein